MRTTAHASASAASTRPLRSGRQREVAGQTFARTPALLVREAEEERVVLGGIGVQRDEQHVVAGVEDLLGAVAVVVVDVEDRNPCTGIDPRLRGDRRVVQVAVAREASAAA